MIGPCTRCYERSFAFSRLSSWGVKRRMTESTLTKFGLISRCSKNCKMTFRRYWSLRQHSAIFWLALGAAQLTSRLTSSSSLLSLSVGVDMPVLAPLALCVAALNAVRLLSILGLPSFKGVEGSGLATLDLETPAPEGFEDDQYPTPGFRCFSISWTEDWILRISSLSVLLLFFSLSPYDFDSSN